ncbi:MAG: thioredoxin family protein, partial [Bacteroidales bacterium]|nr:thioredoxin family protein [Bacteroidales bacterium]
PSVVFLDCYTSWCGPCKMMAEKVFPTKEAGEYFNKRFVNIKIDMEKGEGPAIGKKYGVRAYPTFLILDAQGNEIGRVVGGGQLESFIKKVEDAVKPANRPEAMLEKYNKSGDMADAYTYLQTLDGLHKDAEIAEFVRVNYNKIPIKDLYTSKFWYYILKAISLSNTEVLESVIANKRTFDAYFGKEKTDKDLASALNSRLYTYVVDQQSIPAQNIERGCELFHLLATSPSLLDEMVVKVSKAVATKKYSEIKNSIDGRYIGYSYTPSQMRRVQNLFFSIPEVTDADKAKFLKGYKAFLESQLKGVDKDFEKYKDVVIPEENKDVVPAMMMIM